MKRHRRSEWYLLFLLVVLPAGQVSAWQKTEVEQDSTVARAEADTSRRVIPGSALLRSAIVPGWGQFYTGHTVKGGAMMLAEGILVGMAIHYDGRVKDLASAGDPAGEIERWRSKRRQSIVWAVTLWLYSMADAYVDAHLYYFDEEEPHFGISLEIPDTRDRSYRVWIGFTIPLRKHF